MEGQGSAPCPTVTESLAWPARGSRERAENGCLEGRRAEGRSRRGKALGVWGWLIGEPRHRPGPDCGGGASGQRGGARPGSGLRPFHPQLSLLA